MNIFFLNFQCKSCLNIHIAIVQNKSITLMGYFGDSSFVVGNIQCVFLYIGNFQCVFLYIGDIECVCQYHQWCLFHVVCTRRYHCDFRTIAICTWFSSSFREAKCLAIFVAQGNLGTTKLQTKETEVDKKPLIFVLF